MSKALGTEIAPVPGLTWTQVLERVKAGDIDLLPAVVRSKEREAFLNFTKPYITFPVVIATHRDGIAVSDLGHLAGRRVGVVKGYITNELLARDHPAIDIVSFDSLELGMNALDARQIDAFVDNLGAIIYEMRRLRLAHVTISATTPYKFELCMATRKDWPELAAILDKSLDAIGTREKSAIENTWLAVQVSFGVDLEMILLWAVPIGVSVIVVLVVTLVWNRRLNREIVSRKRSEAALRESKQIAVALMNATSDAALLLDADGNVHAANQELARRFGCTVDDMVGTRLFDLLPAELATNWRRACHDVMESGTPMCLQDEGNGLILENMIYPVQGGDGGIQRVAVFSRDITERKRAENELRTMGDHLALSNAELEQFAYVASHDLRQPLRMISSYLGLIEKRLAGGLDDDLRTFLDFAIGGAKRLDALIIGLLEYSRTGKSRQLVPVDVGEAVREALVTLSMAVQDAGANVTVTAVLPTIRGDQVEIERLFQNLIGNAIKYHAEDRVPMVEIGCHRDGAELIISVRDNGIGIAPENYDRAFAVFQRLVTDGQYEGTGIGLAVCKKIVEHHGGRIWIESEIGVGSAFLVALPAID